jgi:hypothetical protein
VKSSFDIFKIVIIAASPTDCQDYEQHFPNSEILLVRLGHTYLALERLEEEFSAMDLVLKINPQDYDVLQVSGLVLDRQGKKEEAQGYLIPNIF